MSGQSRADMLQQLLAVLFLFIFFSAFARADNDASVEAARAAAHAAEAAREGTGIPALSESQAAAYLDGRSMWMASVAEQNSYPDPRQVLELADKLGLTTKQQQAIRNLYDETRSEAIRLGKQLVAKEQRLNRVFVWGQATTENIEKTVADIGVLQAKLRLTHLLSHVRTKELLTKEQVKHYDELQGNNLSTGESNSKIGCNAAHHHGR